MLSTHNIRHTSVAMPHSGIVCAYNCSAMLVNEVVDNFKMSECLKYVHMVSASRLLNLGFYDVMSSMYPQSKTARSHIRNVAHVIILKNK